MRRRFGFPVLASLGTVPLLGLVLWQGDLQRNDAVAAAEARGQMQVFDAVDMPMADRQAFLGLDFSRLIDRQKQGAADAAMHRALQYLLAIAIVALAVGNVVAARRMHRAMAPP